ncbi:MAG: zinc ribbon domain-containing protein [Candidatus Thorarchaeota archaeon]
MARNRFLFDFLGIIAGVAVAFVITYFSDVSGYGNAAISAGGFLAGGLILGFFAYRNDGVKIAGIICGIVIVLGLIMGVIMITGGGAVFNSIGNIIEAIIGPIFGLVAIIIGIIVIIGMAILAALFVAAAAIGSAIGEAVWKDKQAELVETSTAGAPYQPTQLPTYEPVGEPKVVQPTQPRSVVCPNCGVSNPGTDKFCTNCGAQLK